MTTSDLRAAVAALVREHYVLETDIDAICAAVGTDPLPDGPADAAAALTDRLQSANHDRHLRVRVRAGGSVDGFGSDAAERMYAAEAITNAGGVHQVRRLPDGAGLLAFAPYMSPVHLAEPYVRAAFTLLAGVDRLVIDLRECRGGTPETVALICSHLLGREAVHLQDLVHRREPTRSYWTNPTAVRLDDARIDVLTSERTFSGGEELAYDLQSLDRATVFGETTRGGAHPVELFAVSDVLEATIPVARSRNAVTGTNWEQVGVVPDVACPAADALDIALASTTVRDVA